MKLFYLPVDISNIPYGNRGQSFNLFETRIGADGAEYALIAKGDEASEHLHKRFMSGVLYP